VKCVKCGSKVKTERDKCPKCDTYTVISLKGKVLGEPKITRNNAAEHFVHFTVLTGQGEATCEIKQGYESESPLQAGDEVELEGRLFLERNVKRFRITKLNNVTARKTISYAAGGCLLGLIYPVAIILVTAMLLS